MAEEFSVLHSAVEENDASFVVRNIMTDIEKTRLKNAEANVKTLEKRVIELEEQMALCLKFMRVHAEKMAKEKDPTFKVHENPEA